MIGIVLVSHSEKITEGIKEMIEEMIEDSPNVKLQSAGGTDDGRLGTNPLMIIEAIEELKDASDILIFADIGSALLSGETAIDMLEDDVLKQKSLLVECPLVEGAFAAAVQASVNPTKEAILAEVTSV